MKTKDKYKMSLNRRAPDQTSAAHPRAAGRKAADSSTSRLLNLSTSKIGRAAQRAECLPDLEGIALPHIVASALHRANDLTRQIGMAGLPERSRQITRSRGGAAIQVLGSSSYKDEIGTRTANEPTWTMFRILRFQLMSSGMLMEVASPQSKGRQEAYAKCCCAQRGHQDVWRQARR
jgi:hypothetical protein